MENNEKADTKGIINKEKLLEKGQELFGAKIKYAVSINYPFSKGKYVCTEIVKERAKKESCFVYTPIKK